MTNLAIALGLTILGLVFGVFFVTWIYPEPVRPMPFIPIDHTRHDQTSIDPIIFKRSYCPTCRDVN